jgi:methionyl-tRNA formyltransferase
MTKGAMLVVRTINEITENKIRPLSQAQLLNPGESLKLAPKIHPEDCIIDWNKDTIKIHNFIRGLAPSPCARSFFKNKSSTLSFKIYESLPEIEKHPYKPGEIITDGKSYIRIACADGFIKIASLQLEGKKRLGITEFLRGFRINEYTISFSSQV